MASVLRLISVLLLLFVQQSAFALVPLGSEYRTVDWSSNVWSPSPAAACARAMAYLNNGDFVLVECSESRMAISRASNSSYSSVTGMLRRVGACPANSKPSGAQCACDVGYLEQGGQCVKKKSDICGSFQGMGTGISSMESDFGTQSAKWAGSMIGKSGNSCMAGCQVSGTVSSCVVGTGKSSSTVCNISGTSFTGDECTNSTSGGSGGTGDPDGADKDKPTDCPVGYEPSKFVPGLCIPKPNDCPSGSSPSKYAEGVCIPDEKGDDGTCEDPKDPAKRAACEGNDNKCPSGQVQSTTQVGTCVPGKDGSGTDKDGNKVECKDGKCTTTKPDGTKDKKDQKTKCQESPDLAVCKDSKDTFAGSCASAFSCEGDVLQCVMAKEQHRRNCQLFETPNDMSSLFDVESKKPQENVLSTPGTGTEIDLKGHLSVDSVIGQGVCPSDVRVEVFGKPVDFRLSQFCQYFNAMGLMVMLGASMTCLRILGT